MILVNGFYVMTKYMAQVQLPIIKETRITTQVRQLYTITIFIRKCTILAITMTPVKKENIT